jgi:hypothetical protein
MYEYKHHSFHFCFSRQCPGLVDVHPGDESTSMDIRLLIIGVSFGFHLFLMRLFWHLYFLGWFPSPLGQLLFFEELLTGPYFLGWRPFFFLVGSHLSYHFGHHLFFAGQHAFQYLFRYLFHFCNMTIWYPMPFPIQTTYSPSARTA